MHRIDVCHLPKVKMCYRKFFGHLDGAGPNGSGLLFQFHLTDSLSLINATCKISKSVRICNRMLHNCQTLNMWFQLPKLLEPTLAKGEERPERDFFFLGE